jgi:plasmid stability protein
MRDMKTLTITLDEKTAARARVYAAKHNMSVSRLVGEILQQRMGELHEYDQAMCRFLAKAPVNLNRAGKRYPARDRLHDRTRLR